MTTCILPHSPRHITWAGGEAIATANGNWTMYLNDRPGAVFRLAPGTPCPGGCGAEVWTPPVKPNPAQPAEAHSARERMG